MTAVRLHDDQVDVDEPLARRLLARRLPDLAGLGLRRVPSAGTDNNVFRVGDDLALRLPMHPGAVDGLLKELRWLPVLAPYLSLEVPEVVAVGEPADGYPFPWAAVRWLQGTDALSGDPANLADLGATLGTFVRELQSVDGAPAAGGAPGFVRGLPIAGRDEAFRQSLEHCADDVDVVAVRAVWDDALAAPPWQGAPVWLHADLLPGNLLLRGGRLVGVLDFGAMASGDPAYDATPAWHVLDASSRGVFRDVVGVDDATWRRARGLVVALGVGTLAYYRDTNPGMVRMARRGLREALGDVG